MKKDYYDILGISKNASEDDIKKAFRRLAHQYHPDKKGGDEKQFKEVNEAYQVLSDKTKRANYDRFGTAEPFGPGQGGFSGQNPFAGGFRVDFGGGDMGDLFEDLFEGIGMRSKRAVYERGADLETTQDITLEEAFHGVMKPISITMLISCDACKGKGGDLSAGTKKCDTCNGKGEVRVEHRSFFGSFSQIATCAACRGSGNVPISMCTSCKGMGRKNGVRDVTLEILPGVQNGQIITVKGMGEAGERGTATGDLYVKIRIKHHALFNRAGDDLIVHKELKVTDLLLGKKIEVPTVTGEVLKVEVPAHFNLKENLRIPGEGMPHFGSFGRGDLLVDFIIKAPKKLSGKAAKALEELERG